MLWKYVPHCEYYYEQDGLSSVKTSCYTTVSIYTIIGRSAIIMLNNSL